MGAASRASDTRDRIPAGITLLPASRGFSVHLRKDGPTVGFIEYGPNMRPWGWTVGLGWHTGLPSVGAALDALLADPALGVDVHGEGGPSRSGDSGASS